MSVSNTYGYITKHTRISHDLPEEHYIDARCISGNPEAATNGEVYCQKKIRCHNRQIHKLTILKGGTRKKNQAEYLVKGLRLFDQVSYLGKAYFILDVGRADFLIFDTVRRESKQGSISYRKLKFLALAVITSQKGDPSNDGAHSSHGLRGRGDPALIY